MRASWRMSRSNTQSRKSLKAKSATGSRKKISYRKSLNMKSMSIMSMGSDQPSTEAPLTELNVLNARLANIRFLGDEPPQKVVLTTQIEMRVQSGKGQKKGLRASLLKPKKMTGRIQIGDGKIVLTPSFTAPTQFEVGFVEFLSYHSTTAQDVVLKFFQDDRVFFLTFDSAQIATSFVREIIVQARHQCYTLNKVLESLLPTDWACFLRGIGPQASFKLLTKLSEEQKAEIDVVLRELMDLTKLAKGFQDMDFIDLASQFSSWLLNTGKSAEASTWSEIASKGSAMHAEKSASNIAGGRFLGQDLDARSNGLEAIRNPVKLSEAAEMKAKSVPTDLDRRMELIRETLKESNTFQKQSSQDVLEKLI